MGADMARCLSLIHIFGNSQKAVPERPSLSGTAELKGNENNEAIQALVDALHSDTIRDYITETFDGAVVPAF